MGHGVSAVAGGGFHDIDQGGQEVAVDAPPTWTGLAWR